MTAPAFRTLALVSIFGPQRRRPRATTTTTATTTANSPFGYGAAATARGSNGGGGGGGGGGAGAGGVEPASLDIHGFLALFYCRQVAEPLTVEKDLKPLLEALVALRSRMEREVDPTHTSCVWRSSARTLFFWRGACFCFCVRSFGGDVLACVYGAACTRGEWVCKRA
jgi:hypothetical protein